MPIHRITPLLEAPPRGQLLVPESVAHQTQIALQRFRGEGGRHEGMAFWFGRRLPDQQGALAATCYVPKCQHGPQRVMAPASEVGNATRTCRTHSLSLVAQVHSHPGCDTRHSDGDDELVLMPFEGMFSIVVANYGDGSVHPGSGAGLHQYQDGKWRLIPASYSDTLIIIPSVIFTDE